MSDEAKLGSTYSFRIPHHIKAQLDCLPTDQKVILNRRLRVEIARSIHDSRFDPKHYLGQNMEDDL